mgnify:CR=1 FL=1
MWRNISRLHLYYLRAHSFALFDSGENPGTHWHVSSLHSALCAVHSSFTTHTTIVNIDK